MSHSLARRPQGGALAESGGRPPQEPIVRPLSRYRPPTADGLLVPDLPTIDALATIRAGDPLAKEAKAPTVPTDGKIRLRDDEGRAPGLREELERRDYKSLVIGFAWDDPTLFIRQRMAAYARSQTGNLAVKYSGDETGLASWTSGHYEELEPGTDAFLQAWRQCRPETWVYFYLAVFDPVQGPQLYWPDNSLLPYRLVITSSGGRRNLESCLQTLRGMGQIAGMPIVLAIDPKRALLRPDGARGTGPVWTFAPMVAPEGEKLKLSTRTFLEMRGVVREQTQQLGLPSPSTTAIHQAMLAAGEESVSSEQLDLASRGGACDARFWKRVFGMLAHGTPVESDEGRHRFIGWYERRHNLEQTSSLKAFLEHASEADATNMIDALLDRLDDWRSRVVDDGGVVQDQTPANTTASTSTAGAGPSPDASAVSAPAPPEQRPPAASGEASAAPQDDLPPALFDASGREVKAERARCANCGTDQWCADDGEALVCVDVAACDERLHAQLDEAQARQLEIKHEPTPMDEILDATPDPEQDKRETNAWLLQLSLAFKDHGGREEIAPKPRQRELGRLLTASAGTGRETALLQRLTGRSELVDATTAHVEVLLAQSKHPDWPRRIAALMRAANIP